MAFNGTLVGTPTFSAGKFGQAIVLNGSSQYVSIPGDPGPFYQAASVSWSVPLWVNTSVATGTMVAASILDHTQAGGWWIGVVNGVPSTSFGINGIASIADGAWHLLELCVQGGTFAYLFVDGVLVASGAITYVVPTTTPIGACIGAFNVGGTFFYYWNGAIDECAVFNYCRHTTNYAPETAAFANTTPGLISVYPFENTANDTAASISLSSVSLAGGSIGNSIAVTGNGTAFTGSPFSISPAGGPSITAQSVTDGTHAILTVSAGSATGIYTITESGSGATASLLIIGTQILPNNAAIVHSPANWDVQPSYMRTVNSGAYFRVMFTGTTCIGQFDLTAVPPDAPVIYASIDGAPLTPYTLATWVNFTATPLAAGTHHLEVVVRHTGGIGGTAYNTLNGWDMTVGVNRACVTCTGLVLDTGATVFAPQVRPNTAWVIGDSITNGSFVRGGSAAADTYPYHDNTQTYAWQVVRGINAEVGIIAFPGQGLEGAIAFNAVPLPQSYNFIYKNVPRSLTPAPQLVIYLMGTNDSTVNGAVANDNDATWRATMTAVINGIGYAATSHLQIVPFNGLHASDIAQVVAAFNHPNVLMLSTVGWINTAAAPAGDTADGTHPLAEAHIGKIAPRVIAAANSSMISSGVSSGSVLPAASAFAAGQRTVPRLLTRVLTEAYGGGVSNLSASPTLLVSGPRTLSALAVSNADAAHVVYLQVYDAASAADVTVGVTAPVVTLPVPNLPSALFPANYSLTRGLVVACTQTPNGAYPPLVPLSRLSAEYT